MSDLYLVFFLIGIGLFLFIVAYSFFKKKQQQQTKDRPASLPADEKKVSNEPLMPSHDDGMEDLVEPNIGKESLTRKIVKRVSRRTGYDETASIEPVLEVGVDDGVDQDESGEEYTDNIENVSPGIETKPKIDGDSLAIVSELVAKVRNSLPIEQHELLTLFRMHDFKFQRKVHIFGLNQLTQKWRDIEFELPSSRFVELGVSIELADRDGAMSEKELHDFQQMVLDFTTKFDAPFEFSMEIDDAYEQGQALDAIGRRYDTMAVLNVIPITDNGFRTADVESCARDLMMSSDKNGIFLKTIGQRNDISVLYRLVCSDGSGHYGAGNHATPTTHSIVMYMNVPATKEPANVFDEMVKDANNLATWLEGKVVDQNHRKMTQRSYDALMQQIVDISQNMQKDGLSPGDAVSKKLF